MHPVFEELDERFNELFAELHKAIGGLPQEALDWSPGPEMNSMAVILAHATGSTRYWVGDVAGELPSNRNRAAEFETRGRSAEDLSAQIDAVMEVTHEVLGKLTLDDLSVERLAPSHGESHRVAYAVFHALEHLGQHVGHVQLMRQFWDQRAG